MTSTSPNGYRRSHLPDTPSRNTLPLHPAVGIQRDVRARDVINLRFFGPALHGTQPYITTASIDSPVAPRDLVPENSSVDGCMETDSFVTVLASLPRATLLIEVSAASATVTISASTREEARALAEWYQGFKPPRTKSIVSTRIWHQASARPPTYRDHDLPVLLWEEIDRNYPSAVRHQLISLMKMLRPSIPGRLILWHGPPGTGKTTAVRALMSSWATWCAPQYISDPERFFADPTYMTTVLSGDVGRQDRPTFERAGEPAAIWRLIIAEDSDEYLRVTARHDAGAAMGRLLNLTDGILGQCHQALVLITTNEEVRRLHPALVRPGRCLARIEFTPFPRAETREFLGNDLPIPSGPLTLAELLSIRGQFQPVGAHANDEPGSTGLYL